ncbi:zinc finger protein 568-like isoform X2 [Pomacea canaliculata]|uniref:zinc finger protein 568-like isoform X2 n=1 Tax=Pomacea canaliculata TaxID=400727 RepID=UPI000D725BBB|nr:zinc finger protein 568-like isoform X2 [Pomacea canaliculata]
MNIRQVEEARRNYDDLMDLHVHFGRSLASVPTAGDKEESDMNFQQLHNNKEAALGVPHSQTCEKEAECSVLPQTASETFTYGPFYLSPVKHPTNNGSLELNNQSAAPSGICSRHVTRKESSGAALILPSSKMLNVSLKLRTSRKVARPKKRNKLPRPSSRTKLQHLVVDCQTINRWCTIKDKFSFKTDVEVAGFLIQYYENTSFGASAGYCHSCQGPLTLHCKKCNAPSQQEYLIPLTWPFPGSGDLPLQSSPTSDSSASLDQDTVIEAGEVRTEIPKEEFDLHLPTMMKKSRLKSKHEEDPERKRLLCQECGKTFLSAAGLRVHVQKHLEKPHKCKHCDAAFALRSELKSHLASHGIRPYLCQECGSAFKRADALKVHMKVHTGEMPYKCDVCSRAFKHSSVLKEHTMKHLGIKQHVCHICGKAYASSRAFRKHKWTHCDKKPYECNLCGKEFGDGHELNVHMRRHRGEKPFHCNVCSKSFAIGSGLSIHMRTHTREKPYKCTECGSAFSQKNSLNSHMRTHTGEKPFMCKFCGTAFTDGSSYRRHMKQKHGAGYKSRSLADMTYPNQSAPV